MLFSGTENMVGTFLLGYMADIVGTKIPVTDTICPYDVTVLDSQVEDLNRDWDKANLEFLHVACCYKRRCHMLVKSLVGFRMQAPTFDGFRSFLVFLAVSLHQV